MRIRRKKILFSPILLVILAILGVVAYSVHPVKAPGPALSVSLDANSTSPIDAFLTSSAPQARSFRVGAILNASRTTSLIGVFGWQFSILYDNTTLVPQGDPSPLLTDAAQPTVNFGGQSGIGNPNWAGMIAAGLAFGSFTILPVGPGQEKIQVFYTLLAPSPAVSVGPSLSSTIEGNLLANVGFEIVKAPLGPTSLGITDVKFVDDSAADIPDVSAGSSIIETITNDPPVARLTSTALPAGDASCNAVTGSPCTAHAFRFDGSSSTDRDGSITSPTGYFWDFGDGTQDNVNVGAACNVLTCNQGSVAIHDYTLEGTFNATLRVVDNQGATGSARDPLGNVIANHQPSHRATVVGGTPPKPIPSGHNFSVSLDASSVSQTDVALVSSASQFKSFRIGAVLNASSDASLSGVFGWQFAIDYNATAFVPRGDSTSASYPDGAVSTVLFGSQATTGTINWAGMNYANNAFGGFNYCAQDQQQNCVPGKIFIFWTAVAPNPAVTISARTLLANVNFELLNRPSTPQYFNVSDVIFADSLAFNIPGVVPGSGISEVVTNDPPQARFDVVPTPDLGGFAFTFNATSSSDSDGSILSPGEYFWDFGDGTQDLGITGPVVTHNYGAFGREYVTLRVQDDLGATGSARDSLGNVIVDNQPSHASIVLGDLPPVAIFSTSYTYGNFARVPILFDASKSLDPDGTIVSYSWSFGDGTTDTTTNPSHVFSIAGAYNVTLVVTDDSGSTGKTIQIITVNPFPKIALFFRANDADDYTNGVGEVDVHINGHLVVNVPGGLYHLNGTGEVAGFTETWIDFGPFDVTDFVVSGTNTIVFSNPLTSHVSWIGSVRIVSANSTFLDYTPPIGLVNSTQSVRLSFSNPPLQVSRFTVDPVHVFNTEDRTFTATYNGGTGPFKCTFAFGDGGRAVVNSTTQSCYTVYAYWEGNSTNWWNGGGDFTATVTVQGANPGDNAMKSLRVNDLVQPGLTGQGLTWAMNITTINETFGANITNPAHLDLLVRIDFVVQTPNGGTTTFVSPSFLLAGGQTISNVSFTYTSAAGPGKYCFAGTPTYGIDGNHDGVLDDSEVLGTRHAEDGCFIVG